MTQGIIKLIGVAPINENTSECANPVHVISYLLIGVAPINENMSECANPLHV